MAPDSSTNELLRTCLIPDCVSTPTHATPVVVAEAQQGHSPQQHVVNLCDVHFGHQAQGIIDPPYLAMILRQRLHQILCQDSERRLESRRDFVETLRHHLETDPEWYRAQLVGPFFLLPDWLVARREQASPYFNVDSLTRSFIDERCTQRNSEIRFILTLTPRFYAKVMGYLTDRAELRRFQDDLLSEMDLVWGGSGNKGPDIACTDTGYYQIDYILPGGVLSQSRERQDAPTRGGWEYSDPGHIERVKSRFDTVFDSNYRGLETEMNTLTRHVQGLKWSH